MSSLSFMVSPESKVSRRDALPGGLEQRFLSVPRERLDPHLLPESGAPRLYFLRPDDNDRQAGASVPRSLAREMLRQPLRQILGDAGVERAVGAAEDVDEGHGDEITGRSRPTTRSG